MDNTTFTLPLIYTYGMPHEKEVEDEIEKIEKHLARLKKMKILSSLSEIIIKDDIDVRFKLTHEHLQVGMIKPSDVSIEFEFYFNPDLVNQQTINSLEYKLSNELFGLFFPVFNFKKTYIVNPTTLVQFCENFFSNQEAQEITQGFIRNEKSFLENNTSSPDTTNKPLKI